MELDAERSMVNSSMYYLLCDADGPYYLICWYLFEHIVIININLNYMREILPTDTSTLSEPSFLVHSKVLPMPLLYIKHDRHPFFPHASLSPSSTCLMFLAGGWPVSVCPLNQVASSSFRGSNALAFAVDNSFSCTSESQASGALHEGIWSIS